MTSRRAKAIGRGIVRLYGLVILLVLAWATFAAVHYLIKSVFMPTHVPEKLIGRPGQFDITSMGQRRALARERGPQPSMSHYHQIDYCPPVAFDVGCRASGCHLPMPHQKSEESRAFANFHATFFDCQICHVEPASEPMPMMWVNSRTGLQQDPPAVLELMRVLEKQASDEADQPADVHATIVSLLRKTNEAVGEGPILNYLLLQIDTSEPGSPVWLHAIEQLGAELPVHARMAYGANLAPQATATQRDQLLADSVAAANRYRETTDETARKAIQDESHKTIVKQSGNCLSCHVAEAGRIDFAALGFSARREQVLRNTPIARQMQSIRDGRRFRLPEISRRPDDQ